MVRGIREVELVVCRIQVCARVDLSLPAVRHENKLSSMSSTPGNANINMNTGDEYNFRAGNAHPLKGALLGKP